MSKRSRKSQSTYGDWKARFLRLQEEYVTKKQEEKNIQEERKVQKRSRKQSRENAGA